MALLLGRETSEGRARHERLAIGLSDAGFGNPAEPLSMSGASRRYELSEEQSAFGLDVEHTFQPFRHTPHFLQMHAQSLTRSRIMLVSRIIPNSFERSSARFAYLIEEADFPATLSIKACSK